LQPEIQQKLHHLDLPLERPSQELSLAILTLPTQSLRPWKAVFRIHPSEIIGPADNLEFAPLGLSGLAQ